MKKRYILALLAALTSAVVLSACTKTDGAGRSSRSEEAEQSSAETSLDEAIEQSAIAIADKLPSGTRVALVAFDAPHINLSAYILGEIAGRLVDGSMEVADWNNLEYVYKELGFQMSGEVDYASARTDWEKALQLDPTNADARRLLALLRDIDY